MPKSLIIKIFVILSFVTFAQNTSQLKSDLNYIFQTSKEYLTGQKKINSNDIKTIGAITIIVSASTIFDDDIKKFSQQYFDSTNFLFRNFDSYYHIEFMSATVLGLYLFGNLADNSGTRQLSVKLLTSSLLTGVTTLGLKSLFGRSRPFAANSQYEFNWFEVNDKFLSFPSGHTSLAFSFSTIMAEENKTLLWKSVWFSAATLVGISRIYNNKHWFSDVLLGAVIGYFTAKFVLNHNKNSSSGNLNLPTNNIVFLIRL